MKRGTTVVYINDPLLCGVGSIVGICRKTGRTLVQWTDLEFAHDPHELVAYDDFDAGWMFYELDVFTGSTLDDLSVKDLGELLKEDALRGFNKRFRQHGRSA